jgi:hypothetical protein
MRFERKLLRDEAGDKSIREKRFNAEGCRDAEDAEKKKS